MKPGCIVLSNCRSYRVRRGFSPGEMPRTRERIRSRRARASDESAQIERRGAYIDAAHRRCTEVSARSAQAQARPAAARPRGSSWVVAAEHQRMHVGRPRAAPLHADLEVREVLEV